MIASVGFYQRNNFTIPKTIPYRVKVLRYSWNVFGGPEEMTCKINLSGANKSMLWNLVEFLRCPVVVSDWRGALVWWGYVKQINISDGGHTYGIDIDTMFNRVKATYELLSSGSSTGLRADTVYYSDTRSYTEFGVREKNYPLVTISTTAAEVDAQTRLAKSKYPVAIADLALRSEGGCYAELTCRGWWDTLGWVYFDNVNTGYETVANQIVTMAESGEFITDGIMRATATTLTTEFRQGDNTLKDEIEQLMNVGDDTFRRILAKVMDTREVYFTSEPVNGTGNYYLDSRNNLYDAYGVRVEPSVCKVGVWATLKDFENVTFGTDQIIPPSPVFIERATYDCETGVYSPEQRGYKSPYDEIQDIQR